MTRGTIAVPAPVARLVSFRGASPPWAAPALRGSRRGSLSPARLPWSGLPAVRPVPGLRCFGCGWSCASRSGPEALHGLRPAFRARTGLPAVRPVPVLRLVVRLPFRAGGPSRSAPGLPRPLGRSESMAEAVLCGGESVGAQGFAGSGGDVRTDRKETKTAWINER